jgi:hypothetical protein
MYLHGQGVAQNMKKGEEREITGHAGVFFCFCSPPIKKNDRTWSTYPLAVD